MAVYHARPFKRGDVYYINFGDSFGHERAVGRPGVIMSNEKVCGMGATLHVVFLTSSGPESQLPHVLPLKTTAKPGKSSYADCRNVAEVDKSRLRTYMATLSEQEMNEITKTLANLFDIPYGFVEAPSPAPANNDELFELTAERDYYKRLYEAALNRFVDGRLDRDLSQPPKKKPVMIPDEPEELVDLNNCSAADLKKLNLKDDVILRVIAARPFKRIEDLRYVSGVTELAWQLVKHRLTVEPMAVAVVEPEPVVKSEPVVEPEAEPELVDLNTAPFDVLRKIGFSANRAANVINKRPYKKVEDLQSVPGVDSKAYAILSKKVTVVPLPVVEEPPKLNVNTANGKEISEALGYSVFTGYTITGYRSKHGPFKSLEDLKNVPRLSKPMYEKCLEVLTV